jgi:dTDP-4-amino-4,6-dideoxygalactose transaminase
MIKKSKSMMVTWTSLPLLEDFVEYLKETWDSKWLNNNGKFHQQFEKELAEFLGVKFVSLFSNATLALTSALQVLRTAKEVISIP